MRRVLSKPPMRTALVVTAALLLTSCATTRTSAPLPDVANDFTALRAAFNADKEHVRVVALLSPT